MNNNLEMLKSFIKQNKAPQEAINTLIGNANPVVTNLVSMAKNGDTQGVENFARNLLKEKGQDFDKEFSKFMSNFK